jgi:hypothetical protein
MARGEIEISVPAGMTADQAIDRFTSRLEEHVADVLERRLKDFL